MYYILIIILCVCVEGWGDFKKNKNVYYRYIKYGFIFLYMLKRIFSEEWEF